MIDRMSGRVALLIVVIAIIAIFLLGWFVLLSPERSKASKLNGQIEDTDTQLSAVDHLLNSSAAKDSAAALRISRIAVPDDPNIPQILRQLSAMAGQAGVEFDSMSPQPAIAAASGQQIPLSVSVKGRYFALKRFFAIMRSRTVLNGNVLKANGRLYTVDTIGFAGGAASSGSSGAPAAATSTVTATLTINAYAYSALPAVAGAPVAPATSDTSTSTTTTPG